MKKLIFATVLSALIVSTSFAQDAKPQAKQKSTEELTWQVQALQSEFLYLQERLKNIQTEYAKAKAELDARKPAPATKVDKPEDAKKK